MATTKNKILSEVLKLSPIDRAHLIEEALSSFEFEGRKTIDNLWIEEVEDRIDAFEKGKISTTSYKNVFRKINN